MSKIKYKVKFKSSSQVELSHNAFNYPFFNEHNPSFIIYLISFNFLALEVCYLVNIGLSSLNRLLSRSSFIPRRISYKS